MRYQKGNTGRVFIAKFEDGENPLSELIEMAKKEKIFSAVFWLIGGLKNGRFVVGPESDALPPVPIWREIKGNHEIVGIGTIFWYKDEPKIHLHGVYGREDSVKMGCLRENPEVFLIVEAVIMEIIDVNVARDFDEKSKMILLNI
ncbi:predicted DNA-binding protein with PD1-like DNA-binding motif [Thermodesulfovibrio aggregans]|uniref:Predicted DNA-binding protein with PD1-like DNA-binding motif n=1 Tax=Thermodesulfovibrio aggregans TaxID=86166 RepID=A0A0U9HTS5_9BACT|nr:PPC domain-containing DNA-binding protein [Thermodesulfovibrio aggregans]GAQ93933.1 predicted DNA-binding protein with PD1-like DNA-binding motif [Thermodesulfovibrio aggregans]